MKGRVPLLPSMKKSTSILLGTDNPEPPEWMEGVALREWQRCIQELEGKSILSPIDQSMLANYCVTYAQWIECKDILRIEGMFQMSYVSGMQRTHPAISVSMTLSRQLVMFTRHFGFSPATRKELGNTTSEEEIDDIADFE